MCCTRPITAALLVLLFSWGCHGQPPERARLTNDVVMHRNEPMDTTISTRFAPPAGYQRTAATANSFGGYLRQLPLKHRTANVHLYNGHPKQRQDVHAAVINKSVGTKDLQQCADAVMRLRAEYLFATGRAEEIAFTFTNGFRAPFARWSKGERIRVQGNNCTWHHTGKAGASHDALLEYLQVVFTYAGTASLSKELQDCSSTPVQPGDVFIRGGFPGHAVLVLDVATDAHGHRAFLLAQSYMPAQEIHVLKNPRDPALSPWFLGNDGDELVTPEWTFRWDERKRWP